MECRHVIGEEVQRSRGSRKRYSMCRGCGAVRVSRSYRYISLFWCFLESWSGVVVSPVRLAALGMSYQRSVRSRRGQDWSTVASSPVPGCPTAVNTGQ
jgi:hypothetical protein